MTFIQKYRAEQRAKFIREYVNPLYLAVGWFTLLAGGFYLTCYLLTL